MTNTSPQGKPEEKKETPWRLQFTRKKQPATYYEAEKDLLSACWGNQRMAGVLYHFLYVGSWRAHNANVPENVRTYILQESHKDIRDKLKLKISEPTLISFLKVFAQVGYVQKAARTQALEINFEAVERAFVNPPDKPLLDKNLSSNFSLSASLKEERDEEVERLHLEVEKLTSQVQDLSLTLVRFSSLCAQIEREFKFNFSSPTKKVNLNFEDEAALQARSYTQNDPEGNLIEYRDREEIESKRVSNSANAALPAHTLALVEDNFFLEDTPEQANFAYSHDQPATTTLQACPETSIPAASDGYTQESKVVDPPTKPVKPTSRQRKPKVDQPVLVDTSKKAVAYNEAEQRVFDWYCGCDFIHAKPEQDANKKKHCGKLALHVHSQEEMQSLATFTKTWLKEHFKQEVYVVPLGNMAYSDTLNAWIAKQKQTKRASEPAAPQEIDLNKPVLWTRYQHTGPAIKHWFLYEDMPLVEAQQYGYKADVIVPNDRRNIRTSLKALAEGHQTLTPEEQNEKDHAELRLHLVA